MANKYLSNHEAKILSLIFTDAIAKGMVISLHDGEEWALKRCNDVETLLNEAAQTGQDTFRFRDAAGEGVGSVYCIYGNGNYGLDCITDHSESRVMNEVMHRAWRYIDDVQESMAEEI